MWDIWIEGKGRKGIESGIKAKPVSYTHLVHASSLEEVADVVYISFGKPELKLCVKSMGTDV